MATHFSKTKYKDVKETVIGDVTKERELFLIVQTTADIVYITNDRGFVVCGQSRWEDGMLSAVSRLCKAYEAWEDETEPPEGVEYCNEPKYIEPSPLRKAVDDCICTLQSIVQLTEERTDKEYLWRRENLQTAWSNLEKFVDKVKKEKIIE